MNYAIKKQLNIPFAEAVQKVRDALAKEGFGVLTEIDVQATLKKKLNAEYGKYVILGACNPPFAYEALTAEKDVGLFMPCNVVVYEDGSAVTVAAVRPTAVMEKFTNPRLADIARQAEEKLAKVVEGVIANNANDSLVGEK